VTDPWDRFLREAASADVAGYFEQASSEDHPARAWWFGSAPETVALTRSARPDEVRTRVERFLSRNARGAVVGYLGFDAVGLFEPALRLFPSGSPFPLGEFAFVPAIVTAPVPPRRRRALPGASVDAPVADSLPRRRFGRSVRRLVEAIRAGEAFQVVLAHRRSWRRPDDLLRRAGRLRASERFSSFYVLRFGDREVIGASPESVAEVRAGTAYVDPIAGTLPRGAPVGRRPLAVDPKELCEHRMLVDLARNDLGRVARAGSVRLLWSERRVRYARLEHLVSRVAATVRPDVAPWDVLTSTFPAGTVSGAPKIRASQLLRREEASWRGPYGGAVALLLPRRRATFALTIRSGFAAGPRLFTAAGAGIVHRSTPEREFQETLAKLSVIESALVGGAS